MTVSVGTFDDLRGDQPQPIDRNPNIDCAECGDTWSYRGYWESRYVEGKDWNPAEVHWPCDDCLDEMYAEYELHKRGQNHRTLTEWSK